MLPRLFGRMASLMPGVSKPLEPLPPSTAASLSYPEFSREPVLFEKLLANGQLASYVPAGRHEPGLRRPADDMLQISGDRRIVDVRRPSRKRQRRS